MPFRCCKEFSAAVHFADAGDVCRAAWGIWRCKIRSAVTEPCLMVSAGAVCVSFYDQGSGKGSGHTDPECRTSTGFRMFQLSGKRTGSGTDLFIFVFLYTGL